MASEVKKIQSAIDLPLINPLCSGEIMMGMIEASMSAKIFERILSLKLAKAIGLNWSTLIEL